MITITPKELALFAEFIHQHTGIVLNSSKAYLLESRLAPLLDEAGVNTFTDFFTLGCRSPEWTSRVIDAMTTNETSFFRDQRPFDLLQATILPEIIRHRRENLATGRPALTIWSAACSTGQEVYTVAMIIAELLGSEAKRWDIRITGSDISAAALAKAGEGSYSRYEVDRGVPSHLRDRYFERKGEHLIIRPELRAMAVFKKINLLDIPRNLGRYDLIFCRNVGIYFNQQNRCRLFARIADCLHPDGTLIIGSTESLIGVCDSFVRHEERNTVYFRHKGREGEDSL